MGLKRGDWTLAKFSLAWVLGLGALALAAMSWGQTVPTIATTQVADTVYRADGTGATGTVLVNWPAFTTAAGAAVPAGSTAVTIGTWRRPAVSWALAKAW